MEIGKYQHKKSHKVIKLSFNKLEIYGINSNLSNLLIYIYLWTPVLQRLGVNVFSKIKVLCKL